MKRDYLKVSMVFLFTLVFWGSIVLVALCQEIPVPTPDLSEFGQPGDYVAATIDYGGSTWNYYYYMPSSYDGTEPVPLLIDLHGQWSNARQEMAGTRFDMIAEREGFIALYPQGSLLPESLKSPYFTDPQCHWEYDDKNVGYISALIDKMATDLNVDQRRVYVSGISDGGEMTFHLAYELSEKIAAVAPDACGWDMEEWVQNPLPRPMTLVYFLGTEDLIIKNLIPSQWVYTYELVDYWVRQNAISAPPKLDVWPAVPEDPTSINRNTYKGGDCGTEVIFYEVVGGGHTWPGRNQYLPVDIIGPVTLHIDGPEMVWKHIKDHQLGSRFYFAEGYTGPGFEEWLCMQNPNATPANAHITYMFADGTTQEQDVPIGPTSRATVDVNVAVGPGKNVSVKIEADNFIVAERPMYFAYQSAWTGGHDVVGATSASTAYYFSEGYTGEGEFDEWLCMMNPGAEATTAHITYMFPDGTTQEQDVPIGATSRETVSVNTAVGPDKEVSIKIEADAPIVAERPIYFNYQGAWTGGHDVVGATSPRTDFYFAEGFTAEGFSEYLCLQNPGDVVTNAHVTYMFPDGSIQEQDVPIGPTSRETVDVNAAVGPDKEVSIMVEADTPIVAERPIYFNYQGAWTGGHDVVGATSPRTDFYFAEGYTMAGEFDEFLCLQNPGDVAANAHVTYMFPDGSIQEQDVPIGATSRATVNVVTVVGPNREVSVKIESDIPIVAERPMYFAYHGAWTGGHDAVGYTP
jgi:polyhydroxybutyrate depolymerase